MKSPRVSIVIPVFNQAAYTAACLDALARDDEVRAVAEVIVVDNRSTDDTREVLDRAQSTFPSLAVVHLDRNTGFSPASNLGAERARGTKLVMLNNDTIPEPGWLTALENALDLPRAGIVGPKLLEPQSRLVNHGGYVFSAVLGAFFGIYRGYPEDFPGVNRRREFQALLGACVMVRAETFKAVGGFADFGLEDVDLCLKIRALGLRVLYEPHAVVLHHGSVTLKNSAAGSLPEADTREFSGRWPRSTLSDDARFFYSEDGLRLLGFNADMPDLQEAVSAGTQHLQLAAERRAAGDIEGEESELRRAVDVWLGNSVAWHELLALLIDQRRIPEALVVGRQMIRHLGTAAVRLLVAELYQRCGRAAEADEMLTEILVDRCSSVEDRERAQVIIAGAR